MPRRNYPAGYEQDRVEAILSEATWRISMTDKLVIDTSLDDLGGPLIMRVFRKQLTVEQARAIKEEFGWMGALMLERLLDDELTKDDIELICCHDDLRAGPDAAQEAVDQLQRSDTERLYDEFVKRTEDDLIYRMTKD